MGRVLRAVLERTGAAVRARGVRKHRDDVGHWLAAAREVMTRTRYCLCITETPDGPAARAVQPFRPRADLTVHLGTSPSSRKALEIARTGTVTLAYLDQGDGACVTAHCRAEIVTDHDARRRWFMPVWRAFWPDGPDSEDYVVVRCVPYALEVWDARRGVTPPPFGLRQARLVRGDDGAWASEP